jgi:hypothetical protein
MTTELVKTEFYCNYQRVARINVTKISNGNFALRTLFYCLEELSIHHSDHNIDLLRDKRINNALMHFRCKHIFFTVPFFFNVI